MIYGFKPQPDVKLPDWASNLTNYYWFIRVEGRDKSKRRRYYRYIRKEKLRLVEQLHIEEETLDALCKYLVSFNKVSSEKLNFRLNNQTIQLQFNFN
jgi:hypothetical protein